MQTFQQIIDAIHDIDNQVLSFGRGLKIEIQTGIDDEGEIFFDYMITDLDNPCMSAGGLNAENLETAIIEIASILSHYPESEPK